MSQNFRKTLGLANQYREQENYLRSLNLINEILVNSGESNEQGIESEALSSAYLTYSHLFRVTQNVSYLFIGHNLAHAAVSISREKRHDEYLAMAYYNLAKSFEKLPVEGNWALAVENCNHAIEAQTHTPHTSHDRPAVLLDMKLHLLYFRLQSDGYDESIVSKADSLMTELRMSDEEQYTKDVWLSGSYMRIAEFLKDHDNVKAKEYLGEAESIIQSNTELVIRSQQLQELKESF